MPRTTHAFLRIDHGSCGCPQRMEIWHDFGQFLGDWRTTKIAFMITFFYIKA